VYTVPERFLKLLADLKAEGISQQGVALAIGMAPSYITDIKVGRRPMSELVARRLGEAYDVPWEDLIEIQNKEATLAMFEPDKPKKPRCRSGRCGVRHNVTSSSVPAPSQRSMRLTPESVRKYVLHLQNQVRKLRGTTSVLRKAQLEWTNTPPTKPGYYFIDGRSSELPPQHVQVIGGPPNDVDHLRVELGEGSLRGAGHVWVEEVPVYWYGPIPRCPFNEFRRVPKEKDDAENTD